MSSCSRFCGQWMLLALLALFAAPTADAATAHRSPVARHAVVHHGKARTTATATACVKATTARKAAKRRTAAAARAARVTKATRKLSVAQRRSRVRAAAACATAARLRSRAAVAARIAAAKNAADAEAARAIAAGVPATFFGLVANEAMAATPGADRDAVLAQIRGAGAGTLRQKLDWAEIERTPGQYTWTNFDELVASAARTGVQLLPILFNPPAFRSSNPGADGTAAPADENTFAAFATAAVQRYGPGGAFWSEHPELPAAPVHSWQVWNEPNFKAYWPSGPDPAAYAVMLRTVGTAIHAADPAAEVVAGGLPESYSSISVAAYLQGLYAAGARGSFDTIAVHPYARSTQETISILTGARMVLNQHGDAAVPIWATELGWATSGPASRYSVDMATQARLVQETLTALVASRVRLNLKGAMYYDWQDCLPYAGGRDYWGLHTGLHNLDGSPKPALAAFTATTHALTSH